MNDVMIENENKKRKTTQIIPACLKVDALHNMVVMPSHIVDMFVHG